MGLPAACRLPVGPEAPAVRRHVPAQREVQPRVRLAGRRRPGPHRRASRDRRLGRGRTPTAPSADGRAARAVRAPAADAGAGARVPPESGSRPQAGYRVPALVGVRRRRCRRPPARTCRGRLPASSPGRRLPMPPSRTSSSCSPPAASFAASIRCWTALSCSSSATTSAGSRRWTFSVCLGSLMPAQCPVAPSRNPHRLERPRRQAPVGSGPRTSSATGGGRAGRASRTAPPSTVTPVSASRQRPVGQRRSCGRPSRRAGPARRAAGSRRSPRTASGRRRRRCRADRGPRANASALPVDVGTGA